MEHHECLIAALVEETVLEVDGYVERAPAGDLAPIAVELGGNRAAGAEDELLRVGVIVLGYPVAGSDRGAAHEAGRGSHGLGAQQRADVPTSAGVGVRVVHRPDLGRALRLWLGFLR